MDQLDIIGDRIRAEWEEKNIIRDQALKLSREIIRNSSRAIRAVHREENEKAEEEIKAARQGCEKLEEILNPYPDLMAAGYSRDALKEYAEACLTYALVQDQPLPAPEDLGVSFQAYLGGLGEAAGELRRRVMDIIRHGETGEADRLLDWMDEIYGLLVTMDFPDAITGNLRRTTDLVRGVTERTRGDLTTNIQQQKLRSALQSVEEKLQKSGLDLS
ncbi:MAG: haloacid dehalogenase [Anaerolineales bacterium]|nr:haloacid dehalogenase [Anaerolineales bacterium]